MLRKRLQFCDWQVLARFSLIYGLTPLLTIDVQYDLLVLRRHWRPIVDNSRWFWSRYRARLLCPPEAHLHAD